MEETSEPSSRNGLSHMLSRSRRHRKNRISASDSLLSTGTESDGRHGVRDSIEGAIERLKSHSHTNLDDDEAGNGGKQHGHRGLRGRRRRRKHEKEEEARASAEAARGRSIAERGTLEDNGSKISVTRSWSGDGSSLLTYDSETESPFSTSPSLSANPSQLGFLTTSSPLLRSTTSPRENLSPVRPDGALTPRSATFSPGPGKLATSESELSLPSNHLRAPTNGSQNRSPSPVGRLKDALRPGRKASSQHSSPERKAGASAVDRLQPEKEKSTSDGRRGSVVSKIGSILPDKQSQPSTTRSSPERPKPAKVHPIDTYDRPRTPPATDLAPIIVNTPPTPTDHSVPRFPSGRDRGTSDPITSNPNVVTSPSGNMISHRRVRSGSAALGPSKLSSITSAPLAPTPENGSITPTPTQSGFFNSVLSAAQNAANTLTSSIANTSLVVGGKNKSGPQEVKEVESPEVETIGEELDTEDQTEEKEPAVKTLGMGDLSLSHLGISENTDPMSSKDSEEATGRSETREGDVSASSAVSGSGNYGLGESADISTTPQAEDNQSTVRPRSIYEPSPAGAETPPNGSVFEGRSGIRRSGSIRSSRGLRRKRESSTATGTTIAAAIAAANSSVAHPIAQVSAPKITGFAVASKKRNRDFHQLFRSVPDDDYLIEDYSCALQREILAHGRLYVSEGHLCFSSNIFGWVTTLVMSFDEIVSVEKRSTALVFKNGLVISTLHAKNVFASFTSRDSTYDLIVGIWKLGHPSLRSSINGVRIDETGGGDKTEKIDGNAAASQSGSESDSEEDEDDEIYDEDEDERDSMSFTQAEGSVAGSDSGEKTFGRKPLAVASLPNGAPTDKKDDAPSPPDDDFPGPATHAATDCSDMDTHYSKIIADEVIPAPLGKVYSLMFGPASITWMKNWLTVDQKCLELTMPEDKKPLGLDNKVRTYSYIKPLNGSIGPKQTKCVCTETLDALDFERSVSVTISTQTPDVPSGNVFSTKTRYCLSWAEGNATRLQMNCAIEWTGKSWLKGPIEKGANDGQVQYAKDIVASLKASLSSRRPTVSGAVVKKTKKTRKTREAKAVSRTTDGTSESKPAAAQWGPLEAVRPILSPLADILKPLISGNMMYGLLVGLLVASWFRFGLKGVSRGVDVGSVGTPERIAAYEELWRREESELWAWLEDRVGMESMHNAARMQAEATVIQDRLKEEKMQNREVEDAIRVTEEKLRVLKGVVEKERTQKEEKHREKN